VEKEGPLVEPAPGLALCDYRFVIFAPVRHVAISI
jgi:hypothetical protein